MVWKQQWIKKCMAFQATAADKRRLAFLVLNEIIYNLQNNFNISYFLTAELQERIKSSKEIFAKASKKAKELDARMKNSKGGKEKLVKEAEQEMNACKLKADKSRGEWTKREHEYETLNQEIAELKKGLEDTEQQIKDVEVTISNMIKQREELNEGVNKIKVIIFCGYSMQCYFIDYILQGNVKELEGEVEKAKSVIAKKNKEIDSRNKKKEELLAQSNEFQLKIKESSHEIKKLEETCKNCKNRVS